MKILKKMKPPISDFFAEERSQRSYGSKPDHGIPMEILVGEIRFLIPGGPKTIK